MTTAEETNVRARAPRWMWITLILSLAVNLLVIGGVIGALWHFRYARAAHMIGAPRHFSAFLSTLPRERQDALRAVLDKQVVATGPTVRAMRAARKQMVDAFLAEPFDKQRFSEANRHYMDSRTVLVRMRSDSYPEVVSLLTGGERRAFVKWRQSRRERWRRWRRHEPH